MAENQSLDKNYFILFVPKTNLQIPQLTSEMLFDLYRIPRFLSLNNLADANNGS